jgi:hypothetical protein
MPVRLNQVKGLSEIRGIRGFSAARLNLQDSSRDESVGTVVRGGALCSQLTKSRSASSQA